MKFGSVCSGIEAASVAWHQLGWKAAWLAEIEPFPSAVLAHHYPEVPNLGDMTAIAARVRSGDIEAPDVLVGGTPCQAFSVAGLRGGLSDPRGALTIAYVDLANAIDAARLVRGDAPCVVAWENVPGVLSSKDNAFGCFLGALAGESCELQPAGGRWTDAGYVLGPERAVAWRVLDAQYFGVSQQRRRVFVVACGVAGGVDPGSILFEPEGIELHRSQDECGQGEREWVRRGDLAPAFTRNYARGVHCGGEGYIEEIDGRLRRFLPIEVERIFGFPDDYTQIPWRKNPASECPDGLRYKALGNSIAVPVMRWIGRRIDAALSGVAS